MSLILCRHGQTEFNLLDKFQGVSDSPLTAEGIEKAKQLNLFLLDHCNVKKFYISPLPRVKQTYDLASRGMSAELIVTEELKELCYGDWEEKERKDLDQNLLEIRKDDRFNFVHPGEYKGIKGESYRMQYERLLPLFYKLVHEIGEMDGDIVVLAHHGVMIAALRYFEHLDDDQSEVLKIPNNQVVVVDLVEGKANVTIREM